MNFECFYVNSISEARGEKFNVYLQCIATVLGVLCSIYVYPMQNPVKILSYGHSFNTGAACMVTTDYSV